MWYRNVVFRTQECYLFLRVILIALQIESIYGYPKWHKLSTNWLVQVVVMNVFENVRVFWILLCLFFHRKVGRERYDMFIPFMWRWSWVLLLIACIVLWRCALPFSCTKEVPKRDVVRSMWHLLNVSLFGRWVWERWMVELLNVVIRPRLFLLSLLWLLIWIWKKDLRS